MNKKNYIIFGNGINDKLLNKKIIDINDYIYKEICELIKQIHQKCQGLDGIEEFIQYVLKFNKIAFKNKWKFDILYTKPDEFKNFDNTLKPNFHFRLQDIIKSVLNSWLIKEFKIFSKNSTSQKIINLINFFEYKITTNYVAPFFLNKNEIKFLHGSFYEEDGIRKHEVKTIKNKMACDIWVENWSRFFQELEYVHLSNKYGIGQIKNIDNLKKYIGSKEEKNELKQYEEISKISKNLGYKTLKTRPFKIENYESYEKIIIKSDVIVIYGINPIFDEHLIQIASKKCKKLIFVWYSKKDRKNAKKIINKKKDKLVWYKDFLDQYKNLDLIKDDFIHNKKNKKI